MLTSTVQLKATRIMDLPAEDFHHPYTPYVIQLQFMRSLYACLEEGKVAVFESPTGKLNFRLQSLSIQFGL